jgi:NAD(P)-dependent dehydrogenase (short-subunit alcohol dehydrogenase family)
LNMRKNVLVTGIGKGLGKELVEQLCGKGYFVYGLLRNREDYEHLNATKPENAALILADLSEDNCMEAIATVVKETPLHLVINNAGIGGTVVQLENTTSTEVARLFNVHCLGVLRVMKALRKNVLHGEHPVVINISSRMGSITHQSAGTFDDLEVSYSYRIAKASQNMLTACLRKEFGKQVAFVSLHPGKMKTELAQTDANLEPWQSAERIIDFWENGHFKPLNGILELPDKLLEW